jgi:hypothetical protein
MSNSINFSVTGQARKDLVYAVGELHGVAPVYCGMPTANYVVMNITISKTGEVTWDERTDEETLAKIFDGLEERGYTFDRPTLAESEHEDIQGVSDQHYGAYQVPAPLTSEMQKQLDEYAEGIPNFEDLPLDEREELGLGVTRREDAQGESGMSADDVPDTITIEVPLKGYREKSMLPVIIPSKQRLIKAALGEDYAWGKEELPIEFTDNTVKFEWLKFGTDGEVVKAWSDFLCQLVKFAAKAQRSTATDKPSDNEKFDFRVFGVRIGLKGDDHTKTRKTLARFLTGNSSFKTSASAERWNAKHGKKAATTDTTEVAE